MRILVVLSTEEKRKHLRDSFSKLPTTTEDEIAYVENQEQCLTSLSEDWDYVITEYNLGAFEGYSEGHQIKTGFKIAFTLQERKRSVPPFLFLNTSKDIITEFVDVFKFTSVSREFIPSDEPRINLPRGTEQFFYTETGL